MENKLQRRCFGSSLLFCWLFFAMGGVVAFAASESVYLKKFRALVQKGMHLTTTRKFTQARVEIETALGLYQTQLRKSRLTPMQRLYLQKRANDLVYFIGRLLLYEKRYDKALTFCERVLHATFTKARFQAGVRRCYQTSFGQSAPKIEIRTQPASARIQLKHARGQVYLGRSPFRQKLRPGVFTLTLLYPGYRSQRHTLVLVPGQSKKLRYTLQVVLVKQAPKPRVAALIVKRAKPAPPSLLQKRFPLFFWSSVGLAVASLVAGSALMIASEVALQDVSQAATRGEVTQEEADARFHSAASLRYGGIAMLIVGGVVAAGSVGLLIWKRTSTKVNPRPQGPTPPTQATYLHLP